MHNGTMWHQLIQEPTPYSTDALMSGNAAALRKQYVTEHKFLQKSYRDYLSVEEAGKELIFYTIGNDALVPLKKQYISFGNTMVLKMIEHLENSNKNDHGAKARVQDGWI